MAQLVHFLKEEGPMMQEYIVIDDLDLSPKELEEEYGETGYHIEATAQIDGDVTRMPTNRVLCA